MTRQSAKSGLEAFRHAPPTVGNVRIGPLMNLPSTVRGLGADPDSIFVNAGFNPEQFTNPDSEISFIAGSKLLASCVAATRCCHLGLLLAKQSDPSCLGVAGFMLRSAPDVGTALQGLAQHLDLHDRGAVLTLSTDNDIMYLRYTIHLKGVEATDQIYDLSMALACRIMRVLCGTGWNPSEVFMSRQKPKRLARYRRFFRAPIRFESNQNAIAFPTYWLDKPVASADPLLHHHLEQEANELHTLKKTSLVADLNQSLRKSFTSRKITVAGVAKQLGMHERTLNRRLHEEGTTFRQELKEIRYDMAQQYLDDGMMPLSKIAEILNYADETSFSRAFKRWSGVSPTKWRKIHGGS